MEALKDGLRALRLRLRDALHARQALRSGQDRPWNSSVHSDEATKGHSSPLRAVVRGKIGKFWKPPTRT